MKLDTATAAGQVDAAITPDHVRAYRRDGAVHIKGFLDERGLEQLRQGLDALHAEPSGHFTRVRSADGSGGTLIGQCSSGANPRLNALVKEGGLARLAARLMETRSAQLILDQVFYKEAGRIVPTPWHQDTPFLCVRGMDMARVWLSADRSPRTVTVQVVRGSHRWNVVYDTHSEAGASSVVTDEASAFSYEGIGDARSPLCPDIESHRDSFDILSWDVEPGDAIVFQGNVLHGASGCDHHPSPRRAFATMWGGPNLRYHRNAGAAMPTPGEATSGTPEHGARIADYPEVFPVYWRG